MLVKTLRHLKNAFFYTLDGLKIGFADEFAFRLEVFVSLFAIPLALFLGKTGVEKSILLASWLLIPIIELLNSAIEAAIDRISHEHHELSKRAKDFGSAAVFIACVNAAAVWLSVLFL